MIKEYDDKISGNVKDVVNWFKEKMKEIINVIEIDSVKFDCEDVELAKFQLDDIIDLINAIYQDIITGNLKFDTEIEVLKSPMGTYLYEIKECE